MPTKTFRATVIGVAALFGGWAAVSAQENTSAELDRDMNTLAGILGRDVQENDLKTLETFANDQREPIKLLYAAIQYRRDAKQHHDHLFALFAVHDYKARSRGVYNMAAADDVTAKVRQIEKLYPMCDPPVVLLLTFLEYRDKNIWFRVKGQRVSAARFFRSAFLASAFRGSKLDAVEVANMIDRKTREVDLEDENATK